MNERSDLDKFADWSMGFNRVMMQVCVAVGILIGFVYGYLVGSGQL